MLRIAVLPVQELEERQLQCFAQRRQKGAYSGPLSPTEVGLGGRYPLFKPISFHDGSATGEGYLKKKKEKDTDFYVQTVGNRWPGRKSRGRKDCEMLPV